METVLTILVIFGCSDAGTACTGEPVKQIAFETAAECEANAEQAMSRTDIVYPVVYGSCIEGGATLVASRHQTTAGLGN